ncbi:carbohydrate ABC transporter permease [Brachybacterium alimentarium]|uniref:carbohydrate ABC transporter permease n=1 Tax=Brachybacterium alimentarium TaxID=47845 RepID=UPI003FD4DFA2
MTTMTRGTAPGRVTAGAFVALCALLSALPLLLLLLNSFRNNQDILADPLGLPTSPTIANYTSAWQEAGIGRYLANSVLVSAAALILGIGLSLPIAYALARWRFKGRSLISVLFVIGLMVSLRIGVLPLFHLYEAFGLIDSRTGLVLIYAAMGMPMAVLLLSSFYGGLPDTLGEAAKIDGASEFRIFARVYTPLVRPAIATVVILNIAPVWNDFFFPLIMMRSDERFTLPVGISTFFNEFSVDRGLLYAGLVLAVAPLAVVFAFSMKQVVGGLTAGTEK